MESELISIIVPVYNCHRYINRCLDSILEQTYRNLEIIMVNDGLTDDSALICEQYVKNDSRFKLYTKQNGGSSSARNFGLTKISGEYLVWIDSDDCVSSDYIEKLYNNLKKYNVDISVCNYKAIDELNNISYKPMLDSATEKLFLSEEEKEKFISNIYRTDTFVYVVVWGKLFKKQVFQDVLFPEGKCFDDQATIYKVYLKAKSFYVFDEYNYMYYYLSDSMSHTLYTKNPQDMFPIFEERIVLFEKSKYQLLLILTKCKYLDELFLYIKTRKIEDVSKRKLYIEKIVYLAKYCIHNNLKKGKERLKFEIKCLCIILFNRILLK